MPTSRVADVPLLGGARRRRRRVGSPSALRRQRPRAGRDRSMEAAQLDLAPAGLAAAGTDPASDDGNVPGAVRRRARLAVTVDGNVRQHGASQSRERRAGGGPQRGGHGPSGTRTQNHGINLPHRLSPATRATGRGLAVWTISSPSAGPVRVGGVWPLRALPHHAGLPADRPIPWDFHRPDGSVPRALRGFQQIAADELAVSRLALLSEVPCSAN